MSENYIVQKQIGSGSFGRVYQCSKTDTKEKYAMKRLIKDSYFNKEIDILKAISGKHNNICSIVELINNAKETCIIMPLYKENLYQYRTKLQVIDKSIARKFTLDLLNGLSFFKSINLIHGDLKPENIMVTDDKHLVIIDFGSSNFIKDLNTYIDSSKIEYFQSRYYRSPKIILRFKLIDYSIDMWSLGCILYEMITNNPIFMGQGTKKRHSNNQLLLYVDFLGIPKNSFLDKSRNAEKYFKKIYEVDGTYEYDLKCKELLIDGEKQPWKKNIIDVNLEDELLNKLIFDMIKYEDVIDVDSALEILTSNYLKRNFDEI
jgi:serine/threonine protein kinase